VKRPPNPLLVIIFVFVLSALGFSAATNVYITPNGSSQGACTTSPQTPAWFNNSANWGNGASQIGPGTMAHLCGTITTALTFQGSGTSSSPITLLFESGAMVSLASCGAGTYYSACVNGNGNVYLIVDGGTNGIVQATANGTGLANHLDGSGVFMGNCTSCIVRNLTVSNIYVDNSPSDNNGQSTYGIFVDGGNNSLIYNNTIHDAKWCVMSNYPGSTTTSNLSIYGNTIYHCDHGIVIGDDNGGATLSGTNVIHDNIIHDMANWDNNQDYNHHDCIHTWAANSGSSISGLSIYSNYCYGNWGAYAYSGYFLEADTPNTATGTMIYNNVFIDSGATAPSGACIVGGNKVVNTSVYNNTCVINDTSQGFGIYFSAGSTLTIKNNVLVGGNGALNVSSGFSGASADYNDMYGFGGSGITWEGNSYGTFASYQSKSGQDAHGIGSNPNLASDGHENSNSPTIQYSNNLTNLNVPPLDYDQSGIQRPAGTCSKQGNSSCWDIGAYQYGTPVAPPTGLTAVVN
jgi:hypothetical protein